MNFIIHNEEFCSVESSPFSTIEFYKKGIFETMLFRNGHIALFPFHASRILKSINTLRLDIKLDFKKISAQIEALVKANKLVDAKIKWQIFEDDKNKIQNLIECFPIENEIFNWNKIGWQVGLLEWESKNDFRFNNMKYIRPSFYAKTKLIVEKNKWDDALLCVDNKIIESSIGNIFIIKGENIITPPLNSGCVAGVMRHFLIHSLSEQNRSVKETEITIDELLIADEMFITNAIRGIKWVEKLGNKSFQPIQSEQIASSVGKLLF